MGQTDSLLQAHIVDNSLSLSIKSTAQGVAGKTALASNENLPNLRKNEQIKEKRNDDTHRNPKYPRRTRVSRLRSASSGNYRLFLNPFLDSSMLPVTISLGFRACQNSFLHACIGVDLGFNWLISKLLYVVCCCIRVPG